MIYDPNRQQGCEAVWSSESDTGNGSERGAAIHAGTAAQPFDLNLLTSRTEMTRSWERNYTSNRPVEHAEAEDGRAFAAYLFLSLAVITQPAEKMRHVAWRSSESRSIMD